MINLLAGGAKDDAEDQALVARAREGCREALEQIVVRHQPWIYNLVRRMLYNIQDTEDATQEILVKVLTKLSTFDGRSSFRTWLYRIVVNHVLNVKRGQAEAAIVSFSEYGAGLDATPDMELPDPNAVGADTQLLVSEARVGCTSGMLLCLDREQRLVYILGAIFGVPDVVGAELLEMTRENFRQRLARARRDLASFMQDKCGLINQDNPCRCARKTRGFIEAGLIDPRHLLFAADRVSRVRDVAGKACADLEDLDAAYAEIHRDHPFHDSPDFVARLRGLLDAPNFRSILETN